MIGWVALSVWPVVGIILFNKLRLPVAICGTFMGGYLLLPEQMGVDLPVLPRLDKHSIPALIALIMTAVVLSRPGPKVQTNPGWLPRSPMIVFLMGLLFVGTFGMVLTNQDPLIYGWRYLSGMKLYDGFAFALIIVMALIPVIIARKVLATPEAQKTLLLAFTVSALAYCVPVLWEIRMSPQLHRQIYGFFQHGFDQQIRGDGFRSMVFLSHGLTVSIFLCIAALAAAALARFSDPKNRFKWWLLSGFLVVVLVLNKSLGALIITILVLPLIILFRPRNQLLVAACIAGTVMTYPLLRVADLIPIDGAVAIAQSINPARAKSLEFRFDNEDILLEKARERPVFGWGGWSRNRVFDERGRDLSVTDGEWVLHFGIGGWVRYLGYFGLLCWPIIALFLSKRDRIDPYCAAIALILAAKLLDLIPNTAVHPYIWLMVGSLIGRLELVSVKAETPKEAAPAGQALRPGYSRNLDDLPEASIDAPEPSGIRYTRARTIRNRRTST